MSWDWREVTDEQLALLNEHLKVEPFELDSYALFKRYARRQGETEKLVEFRPGLTFQLLKVARDDNYRFGLCLYFLQPESELYMKVDSGDPVLFLDENFHQLLTDTVMYAIKQKLRTAGSDSADDSDFGSF